MNALAEPHVTARCALEIERYEDERVVLVVTARVGNESLSGSEEYGPFEGVLDVLDLAHRCLRGFFLGEFLDDLLSDLSEPNTTKSE